MPADEPPNVDLTKVQATAAAATAPNVGTVRAIELVNFPPSAPAPAAPQVGTVAAIEKHYDPAPAQEKARANLAYILLAVLVGLVVVQVIAGVIGAFECYTSPNCASAKDSLAVMNTALGQTFSPIVGLVGSVIGFYFGAKAQGK